MKKYILTITAALLMSYASNGWSLYINLVEEAAFQNIRYTTEDKKDWLSGVMTKITNRYIRIDGKEYSLSPNAVIQYPWGEIIKGVSFFRSTESAKVRAKIDRGTVLELIIEELELRD